MPQVSNRLPGAAYFNRATEIAITNRPGDLAALYRGNSAPVGFIDESFELVGRKTFYMVSLALVFHERLDAVREEVLECYSGQALHAGPMHFAGETGTLRKATELVGVQNDGMHIVACVPVLADDPLADRARAKCIEHLTTEARRSASTTLFVLDRRTGGENEKDRRTINDLVKRGRLGRETKVFHGQPSVEPLLGLADVLVWSYRQDYQNKKSEWFDPMRAATSVKIFRSDPERALNLQIGGKRPAGR